MKFYQTFDGNNVPKKTKWLYSIVAIGRDAAYALVSLFLLTFIQYSGILTPASQNIDGGQFAAMFGVISGLVIGYRIFDALNDPFMGVIIEKCHFKSGKYKPWILIGGLSNSLIVLCLFVFPLLTSSLQGWGYVAWFAVFYLLWGITFTMNDIAYWSMLPSLTSDEKQRTSITAIMSIFCSVGQFAVAGLAPIISSSFGYQSSYTWITIIVVCVFALLQVVLFFFVKEHTRDIEEERKHPAPKFKDMFAVIKNNDQVRWMTIILLIYYCASGILNALGINYFYFAVNFSDGGTIMTIFTVVYGLGTILAQFLFPLLSKKFTRAKLFNICIIMTVVGYIAFFVYGLPIGNGIYLGPAPIVNESINILYVIPLALIGVVIFSAQGVFYLMLVMMMANTIEYNEWKFNERKESVIFSLRPLTAKLSSAIQQGVLYLFLIAAGLFGIVNEISNAQQQQAMGLISEEELKVICNTFTSTVDFSGVIIYKLGVAILPMILFVITYVLVKKFYKIDEKTYSKLLDDIKARKVAENSKNTSN